MSIVVPMLFLFIGQTAARAESRHIVAIVHGAEDKLATRLAAELTSHGFDPVSVVTEAVLGPAELKQTALNIGAVGVMRIDRTGDRVSVWITDESEDLIVLQEVFVPVANPDAQRLIALKTVELLRASLLVWPRDEATGLKRTAGGKDRPATSSAAPVPPATRETGPRKTGLLRLAIDVEPAITYGFGKLTPVLHIGAGMRARLWRRLGLALFGLVPTLSMRIDAPEGSADVAAGLVAMGLEWGLMPEEHPLAVSLGVGAGPLFVRMKGHAGEPYVSRTAFLVVAVPHVAVGLMAYLTEILRLRADLYVGWAVRKPVVRMLDRDVTAWGRPLLSVMLGVEIGVM